MTRSPIIDLEDVFVLYRGQVRDVAALRGLSLVVHAGDQVVIHGPSGAGKSTLVQLVTAAIAPNAGTARLFDRELSALDHQARAQLRRESIGIITQHSGDDLAAELTCRENVALQPRLRGWSRAKSLAAADAALDSVGLAGFGDRRPAGLSHGELQRVGIAAAIAHEPTLIVADEPTGQLDTATADDVIELLARLPRERGATLLVATHDEQTGRIADRVLHLADGRLGSERQRGEQDAAIVVDRRGWLRIPPAVRHDGGIGERVTATAAVGGVRLAAVGSTMAVETTGDDAVVAAGPVISRVVDASYAVGATTILPPTTIAASRHELHAVIGRSGSGKTTLLSMIAGWLTATTGSVDVDPTIRIAACPAVAAFADGLSVTETLGLAARVSGSPVAVEAIEGLLGDLGMFDLRRRSTSELSGGERQRLAIGRCLITGADLLILDEPTAQLDQTTALRVIELLARTAAAGAAVVCATHDTVLQHRAGCVTRLTGASTGATSQRT